MPLIVHLVPETADAGAETQARYLIAGLRDQCGWEVELAYFRAGRAHNEFESLGIPLREVPHPRRLIFDLPRRVRALGSLYAERQPAILHAWLDEANLVAALAIRHWPAAKLVISQRCARRAYRRVPYWPWALRAVRGRVDHAIANSEGGRRFLLDLGYSPERTSLIRNGLPSDGVEAPVETVRAQARRLLGLQADERAVGFVGRPDEAKDLGTLFEAMTPVWQVMPRTRLLLLGPTDHELRSLGLRPSERAVALGWRPAASKLMPAFDVLALSSVTEGHSNAVDEALVAGVPVATTNVGGHAPLVAEAGGRVVPVRRPDLLGAAILGLLHSPPHRAQIRTWAASRLAMAPVIDATHRLYCALLDGSAEQHELRRSIMAAR